MNTFLPQDRFGVELSKQDPSLAFGSAKARREQVRVTLRLTDGEIIEGLIHVQPFTRPLDLLNNREDDFVAVTDARVSEPGCGWEDVAFVAVNKSQIVRVNESSSSTET